MSTATANKPAREPRVHEAPANDPKAKIAAIIAEAEKANVAAITSSKNHEIVLRNAVILNLLVAANADIGRVDLLNNLWKGVSNGDRETMRLYIANVTAKYGVKIDGNDGKPRTVSMLKFSRDTGFTANFGASQTNDTIRDAANEMRKAVFSAGVTGLERLTFGKSADRINRDTEEDFNPFKVIKRTIATLMRNGSDELAKIINRDIGVEGYNEQELLALKPDTASQLEKAKARVAKLEKQMPKAKASKPETEKAA